MNRFGRRPLLAGAAALAAYPIVGCESASVRPAPRRLAPPNANPELLAARAAIDGAGANVFRLFPQADADHHDPFVLLDDFRVAPPAGFPMHPHRGFEAFTYMLGGSFHHRDTMGNDSVVSTGGTQRFTSGRGARHSEMPAEERINHGIQLWVNLPQRDKHIEPEYAAVDGRDIPEEGQGETVVRTVVGPGSPSHLRTEMSYVDLDMRRAARHEREIPVARRGFIYVIEGALQIGDREVPEQTLAFLVPGEVHIVAKTAARAVMLAGKPHDYPIHQHGPYVD
jgi:redox-sensitive bicupin YhaK (pirin superfamily)